MRQGLLFAVLAVGVLVGLGSTPETAVGQDIRYDSTFNTLAYETYYWADYSVPKASRVLQIANEFGIQNDFVKSAYYDLSFATTAVVYGYQTGSPIYFYLAYAYSTLATNYEAGVYDYAVNEIRPQLGQYADSPQFREFEQSASDAAAGSSYMAFYAYNATIYSLYYTP